MNRERQPFQSTRCKGRRHRRGESWCPHFLLLPSTNKQKYSSTQKWLWLYKFEAGRVQDAFPVLLVHFLESAQEVLTQTSSKCWGNFIVCQIYKLGWIYIQPVSPKFLLSEHSKRQVPFGSPVIKLTAFVFKQKCFFFPARNI